MAESRPRRGVAAFLTGQADEEIPEAATPPPTRPRATDSPLFPEEPPRRPATRAIRPVAAASPVAPPVTVGPDGEEVPIIALPDYAAPPAEVISAGYDADGVEYVFEDDPTADPLVDPRYDADDRNWVRYRTSWGGFLRVVGLVVLVILVVVTVRNRIYGWIDDQIEPGGPRGELVAFTISEGAAVNDIATDLDNAGIISNATVFRYWLRCEGDITITGFLGCDQEVSFQAGDYELYENMSYADAVAILEEGPLPEVFYTVTIPEGLRLTEVVTRLVQENDRFDEEQIREVLSNPAFRSAYLPEDIAVFWWYEGLLFPATYDIPEVDIADEARFIQRLSEEFDQRFAALLEEHGRDPVIDELGLTDYQIITIASLIEEEAKVDIDRPKMARAIYNRLLANDILGIDASTYYAVDKSFTEGLTAEDLDSDSPYNTRKVAGVPPTPIAAPGEASLLAALQPSADPDLYYWARTDEGGVIGAHSFAVDAAGHAANVEVCRELGYCG